MTGCLRLFRLRLLSAVLACVSPAAAVIAQAQQTLEASTSEAVSARSYLIEWGIVAVLVAAALFVICKTSHRN